MISKVFIQECIDTEVFISRNNRKKSSLFKRIQLKYFTPNTSFVYLVRKMQLFRNRNKYLNLLSKFYYLRIYNRFNCVVFEDAYIGKGLKAYHPVGIVIGRCRIGEDCTILQGVTIGEKHIGEYHKQGGVPIIGNNVTLCANVVVLGDIKIADNIVVGANSVVTHDLNEPGTYGGIPAKLIKKSYV